MKEIRTKLFSCEGISHNGRIFPKDVMKEAIDNFNEADRTALITTDNESNFPSLNNAIGTLEHITIDDQGVVFGDILFLPTPEGKVFENMLHVSESLDESNIHISPIGYGDVNEKGEITHMDITHFNIRYERREN